MARYIDAEKLEKNGWSASRTYPQDAKTMVYETKKMTDFPTADVVEVVRCKDCKHLLVMIEETGYGRCKLDGRLFPGFGRYDIRTWFCADGVRDEDKQRKERQFENDGRASTV